MVKDVCADCNNNRISYIDSYAKEFIEKYFLVKYKKDDTLSVEYDYTMIQKMCLKFAFNDLRARKKDISFFDDEVKEFLLNEEKSSPLGNTTILAGLAVNTSPAPDYTSTPLLRRLFSAPAQNLVLSFSPTHIPRTSLLPSILTPIAMYTAFLMIRVHKYDRINALQRSLLPFFCFRQYLLSVMRLTVESDTLRL